MSHDATANMELKLQRLVGDNTKLTIELNKAKSELQTAIGNLSDRDRELSQEREHSIIIRDCVVMFANSPDIAKLISVCVKYLRNYFEPSAITFYMRSDLTNTVGSIEYRDEHLKYRDVYPFPFEASHAESSIHLLEDVIHQLSISQQTTKTLTTLDMKMLSETRTKSALICKLKNANQTYGYVLFEYYKERVIKSEGLLNILLELFSSGYAVMLINQMLLNYYSDAKQQANVDLKTGCFNSRKLDEDLTGMGERVYTLVSVDIDKFKPINDTYGHDIGDDVLKYFGEKFEHYMLQLDGHAYREGGDEFIGVSMMDISTTLAVVQQMMKEVWDKVFYLKGGANFSITNSMGIYQKQYGEAVEVVKKKADLNLYQSKSEGRARYTARQDVEISS